MTPQHSFQLIKINRIMVISTRSAKQNKRKAISSVKEISYDATWNSLKLPFGLACSTCAKNIEQNMKLRGKGYEQKTTFCLLSKRNKCKQRWSEEFISTTNVTTNQLILHARTCNFLKIPPLVTLEFESFKHKRSKHQSTKQTVKPLPNSRPNPKLKHKCPTQHNPNKKQLPTLTRNVTPDFTDTNDINKNYKFTSSESHSDFHHRIDKLNNPKAIEFLPILADVAVKDIALYSCS